MKFINSLFIAFIMASGLIGAELPLEERERLELIIEQLEGTQARIWPTLNWKSAPLIVTFENGHMYAFNLKSENTAWEKIKIHQTDLLLAKEDRWGLKGLQMQAWFTIEGQQAFVYQMKVTKSKEHDVTILAHERFHRHQSEHFKNKERPGISLDHLNEENLTWIEIEDKLMREFLATGNDEVLKDFIAVNQMRREAIDPATKAWENGQQRMEGLADYAATKAFGGENALLELYTDRDPAQNFIDNAIKWRHYLLGASMAYGLDHLQVLGWQRQIEEGENLADLLAKAVPFTKLERNERIKKVMGRINYKKRRKNMEERIADYQSELDKLYDKYDRKEGLSFYLGHPPKSISGGGMNDKIIYLDEGSTVALNDESVSTTTDGHWKLETHNISHLFQHLNGMRELKVALNAKIVIDQMPFSLEELKKEHKEYPFKELSIQCQDLSLSSKEHVGVLVIEEDAVVIDYIR